MKTPVPLALKVSLWLLLNLLLLAALGMLVLSGPTLRNLLLIGPAGGRLDAVVSVLATEINERGVDSADSVLSRYGEVYGIEFGLYGPQMEKLGGPGWALPPEVAEAGRAGPPRRGQRGGPPWRAEGAEPAAQRDDELPNPAPPPAAGPGGARNLIRAGEPPAYWLVQRVPLRLRLGPAVQPCWLVMRADSLWSLGRLLDFTPWLVGTAVAAGISVLFWLPPVLSLTKHVRKLTVATERIAEGDFSVRVQSRRRDELGRLAHAVDRMAERLDAHLKGQKRFLGDIAHELCSPIARLQLALGIVEARVDEGALGAVGDARAEAEEMSALVNELLAFTRAGLRRGDQPLEPVKLSDVVTRVLAREAVEDRVAVQVAEELAALGDRALLERAVGNLIRNAVRHAGATAHITVGAELRTHPSAAGCNLVLWVEDDGPGVPHETLARLGEPFFRPDEARTRERGGVGLGLAIVRTCVQTCRGSVSFANRAPQGFRAELWLLSAPAADPVA